MRRAEEHAVLQHVKQSEWNEWHFETVQNFIRDGLDMEMPYPQESTGKDVNEACLQCKLAFNGRAAWSVHAFKAHGYRNKARKLIRTSRCDICEREYSTTTRLQAHPCYSKVCYRKLLAGGAPLEHLQPGKNNKREQKQPEFPIPPLPSEGPKEASLCIDDPGEEEQFDNDTLEKVVDELLQLSSAFSVQDCVEAIVRAMSSSTCSFQDAHRTMSYGARIMEDEEVTNADRAFEHSIALEAMRYVSRHCQLSWFLDDDQRGKMPDDQAFRDAAWRFSMVPKGIRTSLRLSSGGLFASLFWGETFSGYTVLLGAHHTPGRLCVAGPISGRYLFCFGRLSQSG